MSFTDVLKKAYPFLTIAAQAVPGGNVASSVLGTILKLKPSDTIETAGMALLNAPPEVRAQLQAEENRHVEVMNQMGISSAEQFEQLAASDRASARQLQEQTRSKVVPAMAITFVAGFFIVVALKLFHIITSNDQVVNDLITTLRDGLMLILAYYFGSSAGSDRKTELLAQAPAIAAK
jgi:hypothetical protein